MPDDCDAIDVETAELGREAEEAGRLEGAEAVPSIGHMDGLPATCPICRARTRIRQTISAHHWGCMVIGGCGHVFPAAME